MRLLGAAYAGCVARLLGCAGDARAQKDFPSQPVRLVNPFAPAGSVDLVARSIAMGLTEIWNQQVIVDNYKHETARWSQVIATAGIKPQ